MRKLAKCPVCEKECENKEGLNTHFKKHTLEDIWKVFPNKKDVNVVEIFKINMKGM